jgi:MoaA/NifB/PqqE/SkfB family radical SAM enzyme
LKLKTLLMSRNSQELPGLRAYAGGLGVPFEAQLDVNPRLDSDLSPCAWRLPPAAARAARKCRVPGRKGELFRCAVLGQDTLFLDARGNLVLCPLLRRFKAPASAGIEAGRRSLLEQLKRAWPDPEPYCSSCPRRGGCVWCPARALLETGDMGRPIPYYCEGAL